ncbi:Uncharacterised protein [Brucella melitensis]|nr:Uncharacterised protein [Brucella melitensis]
MIRIEDRIVIGVNDLLVRAIGEFAGAAFRLESGEFSRIAAVIGRAVAARHVEHDGCIPVEILQVLFQIIDQYLVKAFAALAIAGVTGVLQIHHSNAIGDVLAAGIVFIPGHFYARMVQHVHQVFRTAKFGAGIFRACERGEHAGH